MARFLWDSEHSSKGQDHAARATSPSPLFAWTFRIEWHLWSRFCHLGVDLSRHGEDAIHLGLALPPVSIWLGIEPPWESAVRRVLPDPGRECKIAIHNWAIWINPWSREHEWRRSDPWWVRGLTFHIDDFFLGKLDHISTETKPPQRIVVSLDGHEYHGTAKFKRGVWWRSRWFAKSRESIWIDMDRGHGLPHSGKGENAWDCGDDATTGWGHEGHDVEAAIQSGVDYVLKRRKRYGEPSEYGPKAVAA